MFRNIVGSMVRAIRGGVVAALHGLGWLLHALTGLSWAAPGWLMATGQGFSHVFRAARARPRTALISIVVAGVLLAAGWLALDAYLNRPQPRTVPFTVTEPALTSYDVEGTTVHPALIRFRESVAPLEHIGKEITEGVRFKPAISGTWRWDSERVLSFRPADDWPIGTSFQVEFDRTALLAKGVLLDSYQADVTTAPFSGRVVDSVLYQDPVRADLKHMVTELEFTHPVDQASIEKRLDITLSDGVSYLDPSRPNSPAVIVDEDKVRVYVQSAPLAVPMEQGVVRMEIDKGIQPQAKGESLDAPMVAQTTIPGRYQLNFDPADIHFAENDQGEHEPVLIFSSNHSVSDDVISNKVRLWLLPVRDEPWRHGDVDERILEQSQRVDVEHIVSNEPMNRQYAFHFDAPPGRYLYVQIEPGVEASGGYLSKAPSQSLLKMPDYPTLVRFLSEGALLSLDGEQRLGLMARGVSDVQVEVSRLLPDQLRHLVDQRSGTLKHPSMAERYFDRLVERETMEISFPGGDPAQTHYGAVDMGDYLRHDGGRKGVFVVRISDAQRDLNQTFVTSRHMGDTRMVVITDLGIIAKRQSSGVYDVFVQSIAQGTPVSGAQVRMISRNGTAIALAQTDEQGHVQFPNLGELKRDQAPLMVVVSYGNDLSFLPVQRNDQRLDLSRFDVGGVRERGDAARLDAYVFTDRGLYRPGETAHLGMIVRRTDWQPQLQGLPVELIVRDPRGAVVMREPFALSASGFETRDFTSTAQAPAGTYLTSMELIGQQRRVVLGQQTFSIREFEPDRMKVQLHLSDRKHSGWLMPDQVEAVVQAHHLFGAPASTRRVVSELSLSSAFAQFTAYPQHRFQLRDRLEQSSHEELAEVMTDEEGSAHIQLGLDRFTAHAYQLHLSTRVFEAEGGRSVAAEQSVLVADSPWLVGVKSQDALDFIPAGATRRVHWQAVNPSLDPVAVRGLQTRLVEHQHVSVLVKQRDGTYRYESQIKDVQHEARPIDIPEQGMEQPLQTATPGSYSLVLESAEGIPLNSVRYEVAGSGNASRSLDRNAELQLTLEKNSYEPGDDIAVSIRAPYAGAGLITIERDKVYAHQWFKTDDTSSVQRIRLPEGIEGNAYVNVQFMRDPGSDDVYMSPLSYGVASFNINLEARRLPVSLEVADVIEPGQTLDIQLSSPRATRAIVYAVDEGILQVGRYKTPDPLGFFFRKRALEVDTRQILDLILPEFSVLMSTAAAGGDSEAERASHLNPFKRKGQPPVAWWSGIIDLPEGESTVSYDVPESFNGRLRLMVVSVDDLGVGVDERGVDVRGPLVITPNLPAFVTPGDQVEVTAGIYSNLAQPAHIDYTVYAEGGLQLAQHDGQFELTPQNEHTLRLPVSVTDTLGSATLRFEARLPDGRSVAISETLSVRPASPYRTSLETGRFDDKEHELSPQRTLYEEYREVLIGLDSSPLVWSQGLKRYLQTNSYTRTEQMVAQAVTDLVLGTETTKVQSALDETLRMLRQRQSRSGGFGAWSSNLQVSTFASLFTIDFLLEAQDRGYAVPTDMLDLTPDYLTDVISRGSDGLAELRESAYAAYLLSRQGVVVSRALSSIQEQLQTYHAKVWEQDVAAVYLAASYKLLKQDDIADAMLAKVPWRSEQKAWWHHATYYDTLMHDAERMRLADQYWDPASVRVPIQVLDKMGEYLSEQRYHSVSAAALVRAFDAYGRRTGDTMQLTAQVNKQDGLHALTFAGKPPVASVASDTEHVTLRRSGQGHAFYMLSETGFDKNPVQSLSQGLEIHREYLTLDRQPLDQVRVGEQFLVRLRARTVKPGSVVPVTVVDLLPGGIEPVIRMVGEGDTHDEEAWDTPIGEPDNSWAPDFVDLRDDRVVLYTDLSRDSAAFDYRVRATNVGEYVVPPSYVEGVYDPGLQAMGSSGRLIVLPPDHDTP